MQSKRKQLAHPHVGLYIYRNPLRRSHSFVLRDGVKGTFMSRGSQPNLVSYADDEADHASSSRDESRKKGGHMRNVSAMPAVTSIHSCMPHCHPGKTGSECHPKGWVGVTSVAFVDMLCVRTSQRGVITPPPCITWTKVNQRLRSRGKA